MEATKSPLSTAIAADPIISSCSIFAEKDQLSVSFFDSTTFVFHAQWLHDAKYDDTSSKAAGQVYVQQLSEVRVEDAGVSGTGIKTALNVTWDNGDVCNFPAVWLRILAPIVARQENPTPVIMNGQRIISSGWRAAELVIPEVPYNEIMGDHPADGFHATKARILDLLLLDQSPGILKITGLPKPDVLMESTQRNNLVTAVLKKLFGAVFQHSMRGPDETFKIASHYHVSASRIVELPNYDTDEILLPHTDHSHYENPVRIQGFHAVEGTSENTFVNAWACLETLQDESAELYDALAGAPMVIGRVAQFYNPPLCQTTVDSAVRGKPGYPHEPKCIRWHPHLMGYLLSPFASYATARKAQCKFQEIMYRDSHMVRTRLQPGDMYLWDNFRILHGREKIFSIPRTAVGQTVIEQVVADQYRSVKMASLRQYIPENWLVQTPTSQLDEMSRLIGVVAGRA